MTVKTANNKYIGALFNFFEFAVGNYDKANHNPFQNATLPTTATPREEWDPFTPEALRTFFSAPLYRGCKSAKKWLEPGREIPRDSVRFWLPLVLERSSPVSIAIPQRILTTVLGRQYRSVQWKPQLCIASFGGSTNMLRAVAEGSGTRRAGTLDQPVEKSIICQLALGQSDWLRNIHRIVPAAKYSQGEERERPQDLLQARRLRSL